MVRSTWVGFLTDSLSTIAWAMVYCCSHKYRQKTKAIDFLVMSGTRQWVAGFEEEASMSLAYPLFFSISLGKVLIRW